MLYHVKSAKRNVYNSNSKKWPAALCPLSGYFWHFLAALRCLKGSLPNVAHTWTQMGHSPVWPELPTTSFPGLAMFCSTHQRPRLILTQSGPIYCVTRPDQSTSWFTGLVRPAMTSPRLNYPTWSFCQLVFEKRSLNVPFRLISVQTFFPYKKTLKLFERSVEIFDYSITLVLVQNMKSVNKKL